MAEQDRQFNSIALAVPYEENDIDWETASRGFEYGKQWWISHGKKVPSLISVDPPRVHWKGKVKVMQNHVKLLEDEIESYRVSSWGSKGGTWDAFRFHQVSREEITITLSGEIAKK
jgi:hypothetical protein